MSNQKLSQLAALVESAKTAIEGFYENNADETNPVNEIERINRDLEQFVPQDFKKEELKELDDIRMVVFFLLRSDKNESYNKHNTINIVATSGINSISYTYILVSGLHDDVRFGKTRDRPRPPPSTLPPPPPVIPVVNASIAERITALEREVTELQKKIDELIIGGKTRRKRSRKVKKSRRHQ